MAQEQLEKLAVQAKKNPKARAELIERLKDASLSIVAKKITSSNIKGLEVEDYLVVIVMAVDKAIEHYDETKCAFFTFYYTVLCRTIYRELEKEFKSNYYLHNALSLDESITSGECATFHDVITSKGYYKDPRHEANFYELIYKILALSDSSIKRIRHKNEIQCSTYLGRYIGFNCQEIANMLSIGVDRLKKILNDESIETIRRFVRETYLR